MKIVTKVTIVRNDTDATLGTCDIYHQHDDKTKELINKAHVFEKETGMNVYIPGLKSCGYLYNGSETMVPNKPKPGQHKNYILTIEEDKT